MTLTLAFAAFALAVSILAFISSLRMGAYQKHEYQFFLQEHEEKLGKPASRWARFLAWNAALGGPAPRWHWIRPVISPRDTFNGNNAG